MSKPKQQWLPGFKVTPEYSCPLCGEIATLFGQFSPHMPWFVCKKCSEEHPYPVDLFIPSTRRNKDKEPLMIDPNAPHKKRELRIQLDEMLRCAVDPTRIERPIIKYNLSGLEIRYPIRRSKAHIFNKWSKAAAISRANIQMTMPLCHRCGRAHDRKYKLLVQEDGPVDYWTKCQRCADEESVETFWRLKGIFGGDDVESILDRIQKSHPELFEREVLPNYWYTLMLKEQQDNL